MHRQLAGELQAGSRRLDRIDVADHVSNRHVGRGELLDVAEIARKPGDRHAIAFARDARAAGGAQRFQRIVVDLAPWNDGNDLVEQCRERAQQPRFCLTAKAEQDEVVL